MAVGTSFHVSLSFCLTPFSPSALASRERSLSEETRTLQFLKNPPMSPPALCLDGHDQPSLSWNPWILMSSPSCLDFLWSWPDPVPEYALRLDHMDCNTLDRVLFCSLALPRRSACICTESGSPSKEGLLTNLWRGLKKEVLCFADPCTEKLCRVCS